MTVTSRILSALAAVALAACGGSPPPVDDGPGDAPPQISSVERFLPLKHDTVYSYDTESESSGEKGMLIMQITRPREGRADLKVGSKVRRLELVPDGIRMAEGGYLLKAPIQQGSQWRGAGSKIRVTAIDKIIEVPAGKFDGCIETVEESGGPTSGRKITTVFCPHVGIVSLDAEGAVEGDYLRERAVLKSFGPRVDIGAPSE